MNAAYILKIPILYLSIGQGITKYLDYLVSPSPSPLSRHIWPTPKTQLSIPRHCLIFPWTSSPFTPPFPTRKVWEGRGVLWFFLKQIHSLFPSTYAILFWFLLLSLSQRYWPLMVALQLLLLPQFQWPLFDPDFCTGWILRILPVVI